MDSTTDDGTPTGDRLSFLPRPTRRVVRFVGHRALSPVGSIAGGRGTRRVVALTFDDGPSPDQTPAILDVLARHDVRGTFFALSGKALAHPEVMRRLSSAGHEVALHGTDHSRLTGMPHRAVQERMTRGRSELERLTGQRVRWFRPPYGSQSVSSYLAARRAGMQVVVWTAVADDWLEQRAEDVANRALARLRPGTILLLHDAHEPDPRHPAPAPTFDRAESVDLLLRGMARSGYDAVTVSELVAKGRLEKRAWFKD